MSAMLTVPAHGAARVLFVEDFDDLAGVMVVEARSEVEVIAPTFTATDLEEARARAHAEGLEAAQREAALAQSRAAHAALVAIATSLDAAARDHAEAASEQADQIAGLLLDVLMTFLPALCARHGESEARAVARAILPALTREPAIAVRVSPSILAGMQEEIDGFDQDLASRIRLLPIDTMTEGDVRISWNQGGAAREIGAVWEAVAEALSETGLLVRPLAGEAADVK